MEEENEDSLKEINNEDKPVGSSDEDSPVYFKEKIKLFLGAHWRGIFIIIIPLILLLVLVPFPPQKYQWCAYTLVLMAAYWVTECIPLAITSFLPILIFPMSGIMNTTNTCKCYMNDTVVMFIGSMALAYAVEQSGLHKRLALCAIRAIGYSHYKLLFAMSFITMFISMWITNTAATTMMVPINFALLKVFEDQEMLSIYELNAGGERIASDITTCYFCAASFSATIGGIGTLVGTATNLVLKGLFHKAYPEAPEYLSFPNFSAFSIPLMLVLELAIYLNLLIVYFGYLRPKSKAAEQATMSPEGIRAAKNAVEEQWTQLGKITFWEIMVIILFGGAILLFFCRSPQIFNGWGDIIAVHFGLTDKKFIQDSAAAILIVFLMFLLPSNLNIFKNCTAKYYGELPDKTIPSVLGWREMNEIMPFSFMFLLGGGFALSEAAKKEYSDLNGKIGEVLKELRYLPNFFIIFLIIVFTIFTTNFAANVAVCNVIAPIVMQLAKEVNINPLWYDITAGFTASFCFCIPVGTPGNLVVQSAASIPTRKFIKAGSGPTLLTILVTWIFMCFWAPVIWPDLQKVPNWVYL